MQVGAISAAGLKSVRSLLQQLNSVAAALQTLQSSLSSGDLNGAQAAFGTLQQLNQSLATASGNSLFQQFPTLHRFDGARQRADRWGSIHRSIRFCDGAERF